MNYTSTRSPANDPISAQEAIKRGIAPDGGLYMPMQIPVLTLAEIDVLCTKSYAARAAYLLGKFLTDYPTEDLLTECGQVYSSARFPGGAAPVVRVDDTLHFLELWHGPTAAFKDMALQIMPRLLSGALRQTGEERTALILVATSGDTGKAALEGYKDIDRIKIMVFYPVDGVSKVQKLQMATQTGSNVNVCAIKGNFDDAQTGVKKIFSDKEAHSVFAQHNYILSSANSINWGRLAPQIVYYISAYCDMLNSGDITYGEKINVCVPTGNFGNIFAAYIAKMMGLPIGKLICASNSNNVLTDFIRTGSYDRNRKFYLTMSPSMDILISSNLERLLYLCAGAEKTAAYMSELSVSGKYTVSEDIKEKILGNFVGYFADEDRTAQTLKAYYEDYGYLADTHTSVALSCAEQYMCESGDTAKIIVASTASPYKFAADVYRAITSENASSDTGALEQLSALTGTEITYPLRGLTSRQVNFKKVIEKDDMLKEVYSFM